MFSQVSFLSTREGRREGVVVICHDSQCMEECYILPLLPFHPYLPFPQREGRTVLHYPIWNVPRGTSTPPPHRNPQRQNVLPPTGRSQSFPRVIEVIGSSCGPMITLKDVLAHIIIGKFTDSRLPSYPQKLLCQPIEHWADAHASQKLIVNWSL